MSTTGGGEGRWPFERVGEGASPSTSPTPQWAPQSSVPQVPSAPQAPFAPQAPSAAQAPGTGWGPAASATPPPASPTPPPAAQPTGFGVHAGSTRPPAPAGTSAAATPPGSRRDGKETKPARRRPPLWLLILIGVVVVGAIVAVVLLLTQKEEPEAPPAATVTLPVPTPTIEAITREPGSPFFEALPSEVLQFALTEVGESEDMLLGGALEGYRFVYSDGGSDTLTVLAGQWRDAAGPQARLDAVLAEVGEVPEASDLPEPEATEPAATDEDEDSEDAEDASASPTPTEEPLPSAEQGPVEVDGQEVGRYVFVPREDGTGTLWWTNATVFIQLDGPWAELRDFFTAYPL